MINSDLELQVAKSRFFPSKQVNSLVSLPLVLLYPYPHIEYCVELAVDDDGIETGET